jgi:N-acetylmuramoyl-L-alanine amidase
LNRLFAGQPVSAPARSLPPVHRIHKVVIDAGHGGEDFGAISPEGLREKQVVLDIAQRVRRSLEARGLEVVMTRNSDVFIPLAERARIANKTKADFFVSIHANASLSRSLRGFEVYYLSEATDDAALALERAENSVLRLESAHAGFDKGLKTIFWDMHESENRKESLQIAEQVKGSVTGAVSTAAQRIRTANFYVLKWTECPAVLVETGYLTNRQDERLLHSPVYRAQMAEAVVDGILNYRKVYESTDGFTR